MRRYLWAVGAVVVIGALFGYSHLSSIVSGGRSPNKAPSRPAVPVTVASVIQRAMPLQIRTIGTVEANSTVAVRAQVSGQLTRVHFKEGEDVKKGEVLFTIDSRPFEAALKQAEANLARDLAQMKNAEQQAQRYAELVKRQFVAQEQYDQLLANARALEATVRADTAAVETAKIQLGYCTVRSPLDGRTGSLLVDEGNLVAPNDSTPMVIINQVTPILVVFSLPERDLLEVKRRMAAGALELEAVVPQTLEKGSVERGVVTFVDNAVDRATGTIRFRGAFANREKKLWPGLFVNLTLTMGTREGAIVVPARALQRGQDGMYVFLVKPDLTVEVRSVSVSASHDGQVIIEKGLLAGERVVTDGQLRLAPGFRVTVKEEGAV
jgi:multidrug efflux system membrane fusion protein